jgi:hypothetical protein
LPGPDAGALRHVVKAASVEHHEKKGFFGWFNARFDQSVNHYTNSVSGICVEPAVIW